jgi:carbon storage regulator CsrA
MLVLSRRTGEKIVLPGLNVTIQIISAKPGAVRLGIDAPPDVRVLREELQGRASGLQSAPPAWSESAPCLV